MKEGETWPRLQTPIGGVPAPYVPTLWPYVLPLLELVVRPRTGFTLESVYAALLERRMQLWVIGDLQAIVITTVQERYTENVLWVQFIAGSRMRTWLDDWIVVMTAFAREKNCAAIEFAGRSGWAKIWKSHRDWQPVSTTYRKDL